MSFDEIIIFLDSYRIGDFASLIGLLIAIVGFSITIINVSKSKSASLQAANAVSKVREDLRRMETVTDFASALASMEDVKRLHRDGAWQLLPERYSNLRKTLIAIRSGDHTLLDDDKKIIQAAITQFSSLEREVDKYVANKNSDIDVPKINAIVSKRIDCLHEVLIRLKSDIGDDR